MDGLKKILIIFALMVLVIGFAAPSLAQYYGGARYGQPSNVYQGGMSQYQGGRQMMPQQGGQQQQQMMPRQGGQQQQGGLKESNKDIMVTMEGMSDLGLFVAAVKAAGEDKLLSENEGPFMVFAPNDKAIEKDTGITDVESLTSDAKAVKEVVDNCIVSKVTEPPQGSDSFAMTTLGGKSLTLKKSNTGITVNGKKVVNVIKTENGMLIVTDSIVGL
jgi:uncharacterized surface protein with fasciclin (FAS1) repeats